MDEIILRIVCIPIWVFFGWLLFWPNTDPLPALKKWRGKLNEESD